ncbi:MULTISPECIES: hypothetical protein [Methylomicrobium]|uniref:Uncharacterized protein n=1 Tax=Methylomicrobium album BG8 TaxID=686340 RepID=H8GLL4_METAL|nr:MULTISPECIES: hypothetical protein [Methylomicrobium]EIC29379.1 hypothetical protein Metal_1600 [Methylomicrobium album BG8]
MSNEDKTKPSLDTAKNLFGNLTSAALNLKETKPKVFYGAVGGVALLVLIAVFSGGESRPAVQQYNKQALAVGQTYSLKSPNSYDPNSTIRIVPAPGTLAAYDDTEEADRTGTCQHFPQGTKVKVLRLQDAFDTANSFAEVSIEGGECNGKTGWVLSIDLQ